MPFLKIDSKDRSTGDPGNYNIELNSHIKGTNFRIFSVCLPRTYYNIPSNRNSITVDVGSGNQTVSITSKHYTYTSLASALETALQTLDPNISVSYDSTTAKITISDTVNFSIDYSESSIAPIIGLEQDKSGSSSYEMDGVLHLGGTRYIDIFSNTLSGLIHGRTYTSDNKGSWLLSVPMEVGFLENQEFSNDNSKNEYPNQDFDHIKSIDITLRNEYGDIIDFNGVNNSMIIHFD